MRKVRSPAIAYILLSPPLPSPPPSFFARIFIFIVFVPRVALVNWELAYRTAVFRFRDGD